MLKIIAGGAVAALMMVAAPSAGVAAGMDRSGAGTSPAATQPNEQATEFSDQRRRYVRRYYRPRYVRPYYYPYAYRPYYSPYRSYGYYGYPYYRRPGIYFGFGF